MPVTFGSDKRGCFAQWGNKKKYYYKCGSKEARERAKNKAEEQARAIYSTVYKDNRQDAQPGNERGKAIKEQLEVIGIDKPKGRQQPYRQPMRLERDYWSRIRRALMMPLGKQIRDNIYPQLSRFKDVYERGKMDNYSDDITELMNNLQVKFAQEVETKQEQLAAQQMSIINAEHMSQTATINKALLTINPITDEPWLDAAASSFVRENVNYIKKDLAEHYTDIEGIIRRGLESGESVKSMQGKIAKRYRTTKSRAKLIARDQTNKFFGQLTRERATDLGITHFIWVTAGDQRVRDSHRDLNGRRFSWKTGADGLFPGMDIQCRCVARNDYSVFF